MFKSENMRAGLYCLAEVGQTPKEFVDKLLSGKIETPHGEVFFPPEQGQGHSLYFAPFFFDATSNQRRQVRLSISGGRRTATDGKALDWELKAAPTPYFDVQGIRITNPG